MDLTMIRENPTSQMDIRFTTYLSSRKAVTDAHIINGVPDYAYASDRIMMQKINAIPGAFQFFKALLSTIVPRMKQALYQNSLKVGPTQFADVYEQTVECARILGVGIPTTFIENSPIINAYALAAEDDAPVIILTSSFLERFTPGERKAVIGHELGHIQNNHGIYSTAVYLLLNVAGEIGMSIPVPGLDLVLALASWPLHYALMAWSRAAEITSDRAGVICADDPNDMFTLNAKFMYGAAFNREDVNIDAILKQYERMRSNPVRLIELDRTHPIGMRRILAAKTFMESEVLHSWRPEWREPGMQLLSKQELDARCEKFLSVMKKGASSGGGAQ